MLRLGGFFSVPGNHLAGWRHPDAIPTYDMDFQGYAHITQVAEAAKFDCIFFQDTVGVSGSRALARGERARAKLSRTVKLEPTATLAALAMVTEHIGLVATATTTYNEPYNIARRFMSIDHISDGRAGWNLVTSQIEDEFGEFRLRPAHGACRALRARRRVLRGRHRPVGFVGGRRRPAARQGERPLHGPRQGPFPRPRRQVLQGEGTAQHHALGPGLAGDRPGGLVRGRPRSRRAHRRRGVHGANQDRRGQGVLRRHQAARGDVRPGARGHQDHARPDARAGRHDGTRRRRTTRSCSR